MLAAVLGIVLLVEGWLRPENYKSLPWIAGFAGVLCVHGVLWEKTHPQREIEDQGRNAVMLHWFRKRDLPALAIALTIALLVEARLRPENGKRVLWVAGFTVILCIAGVLWENRQAKKHPQREPESPWVFLVLAAVMAVLTGLCFGPLGGDYWPVYAALCLVSLYMAVVRFVWERKSAKEIAERLQKESKES